MQAVGLACRRQLKEAEILTLDHIGYCKAAQVQQRLDVQIIGRLNAQEVISDNT